MEGGCEGSSAAKEMGDNQCLKSCIQEKIKRILDIEAFESAKPEKFRIYRVSAALHELNEHAYSPRIVSIGPLHRGKGHLLAMEERKLSYMQCLFNRAGEKKEETLGNCVLAMLDMESDARNCYAEEIKLIEINVKPVIELESKSAPHGANCDCNTEKFKFAEMMLIDGCFIIELLYRHHQKEDQNKSNDHILRNSLQKSTIQDDLLLLENQIPFSILKKLYDLTVKCIQENQPPREESIQENQPHFLEECIEENQPLREECIEENQPPSLEECIQENQPPSLEDCVLSFFDTRIRITNTKPKLGYIKDASQGVVAHLLDFSHKIHVYVADILAGSGEGETESANRKKGTENTLNLSATEIHFAGVEFKKKDGKEDLFAVEFEEWGIAHWPCVNCAAYLLDCCPDIFIIPVMFITFICCIPWVILHGRFCQLPEFHITPFSLYDYTELLLRNLIAYEQCCPDIESYFTSHAKFMDTLIDSAKDVELLEKAGVIQNHLGCSDEAAKLFNNLCKHIVVDNNNFYIRGLPKVEKYCTRRWPRNLRKLRRDYFGNPWSGIAVIATFFIFTLTLLQTTFTILSYHQ